MMQTVELCGKCANLMKEGFALKRVAGGVDQKVTCANCGKRRYGATYEVSRKERQNEKGLRKTVH